MDDRISEYFKEADQSTAWNLGLDNTQVFPVTLGSGNPQPLSSLNLGVNVNQEFQDDPDEPSVLTPHTSPDNYSTSKVSSVNLRHGGNFSQPVQTVILHWTGGSSAQGAINTLKQRGLSYHAIIERNGNIIQTCPYDKKAWHAGKSFGPQGAYCNSYSIGISFVNLGKENGDYPLAQRQAAYKLISTLKTIHPLRFITGHVQVAPKRKRDPVDFPWAEATAQTGLIFWAPSSIYISPAKGIKR